jgi:hypothetical protein
MGSVDISGIDKRVLLKALWLNSEPAPFFDRMNVREPKYYEPTDDVLGEYIDYWCGRLIKTDISKNTAFSGGYDRDYGQGAFERVVRSLREKINKGDDFYRERVPIQNIGNL